MPLLATTPTGQRFEAWRLSPQDWDALKGRYRTLGLTAACCGHAAIPVTSAGGWQFFRHAPREACAAREGPDHVIAKSVVARAAAALGLAVTTEARGDGWVADVLVEAPRWTAAIEIQLSRLPLDAIAARQRRYAAAGVRGAWLVGYAVAEHAADRALPLFRLLARGDGCPVPRPEDLAGFRQGKGLPHNDGVFGEAPDSGEKTLPDVHGRRNRGEYCALQAM